MASPQGGGAAAFIILNGTVYLLGYGSEGTFSQFRDFVNMLIYVGRECATLKKCFKIIVANARFRENVNFC
jgi:hypothetical protein